MYPMVYLLNASKIYPTVLGGLPWTWHRSQVIHSEAWLALVHSLFHIAFCVT